MNEEDIIKNLKEMDEIQPANSAFLTNLKKRITNKREIILNENLLIRKRKSKLLDLRFWFTSMAFMGVMTFAIVILIDSKPNFSNEINLTANNNSDQSKNVVMDIGNEKVIAQEYDYQNNFINFKLPQTWKLTNTDFKFEKGEYPVFGTDDKFLTLFNSTEKVTGSLTSSGATVLTLNNYKVVDSQKVEKQFLEEFVETNVGSLQKDLLFENNYWLKLGDPGMYVLFSFEKLEDVKFLESILKNLNFSNPMQNWDQLNLGRIALRKSHQWNVSSKTKDSVRLVKETSLAQDSANIEFNQAINIKILDPEFELEEENEQFVVYGKTILKLKNEDNKERFIVNDGDEKILFEREIILTKCEQLEETCNKVIQDFADDLDYVEHLLIIWSISISDESDSDMTDSIFESDHGFSFMYDSEGIINSATESAQYRSLVEQVNLNYSDVDFTIYVLDRDSEDFVFDLSEISSQYDWKSTPESFEEEIDSINATKTKGRSTINEVEKTIVTYLLNENGNTIIIRIIDDSNGSNNQSINKIIQSIKFND